MQKRLQHRMNLDNINLANKKNRVGKSRLEIELNRINREQWIEMRMHNNTKQRIKNRYAKLDVFDENRGSEASDVVMYETHNPGFCYRRNGECRLPQSNITSSSLDMEDLHMLLFTNKEIDIDKMLCLYLLAAHKCESLTPPPITQRTSFLAREQSPLERLFDRSKKRIFENKLKDLPLYILDSKYYGVKDQIKDPRLQGKIIINSKIIQMVYSVKVALEISNPETMSKFMTAVENQDLINSIMGKPKMIKFLYSLYGQNIISSCESFYLESPQKQNYIDLDCELEVMTNLARSIRKYILQKPNTNSWRMFYKSESESDNTTFLNTCKCDEGHMIFENSTEEFPSPSHSEIRSQFSSNMEEEFKLDSDDSKTESFISSKLVSSRIMKNHQKGFSNIEIMEDMPSPASTKYDKMELDKLANLLSRIVNAESRRDFKNMLKENEKITPPPPITTPLVTARPSIPESLPPSKIILKQTTCLACINKWKNPLPTPKTSKIKKFVLPVLKDTSYFSSKGAQRISAIIDDEVKRFGIYDRSMKMEKSMLSNRAYQNLANGNYSEGASIEIIDLDDLELAKIRQEIRDNELKKKLRKFMEK